MLKLQNIIIKPARLFIVPQVKFARRGGTQKLANNIAELASSQDKQSQKNSQKLTNKQRIEKLNSMSSLGEDNIEAKKVTMMLKEERFEEEQQNQKYEQLQKRINEHMYNETFDKQLDQLIEKKVGEGKSNSQILDEILGKSAGKKQDTQKDEQNQKLMEILENSEYIGHDGKKQKFSKGTNPYLTPQMESELGAIEEYQKIIGENQEQIKKMGQLSEEPLWKYASSNKLSKSEKEAIQLDEQIIKQNLLVPGVSSKDIKSGKLKEIQIMQEGDKNRLTKAEQRELMEKISTHGMEDYSNIIGEGDMPRSALDLKIQYLQEGNNEVQGRFKDLIISDRDSSLDHYGKESIESKKEDRLIEKSLKLGTFGKQETQLEKYMAKYNLDEEDNYGQIEEFKEMQKEELFALKKLQEENEEYKKYLEKKRKIKEFRKYEEQLNQSILKDNTNYSEEDGKPKLKNKILKDKELGIIDTDHIDQLNEIEQNTKHDTSKFDYHKARTLNNVKNYIEDYFSDSKPIMSVLFNNQNVYIKDVYMNDGLTVVYIFWDISRQEVLRSGEKSKFSNITSEEWEKQEKLIQKKLQNHAGYLSGKICTDLGFKFGPQIRFNKSMVESQRGEAESEIQKSIPDIVNSVLIEDLKLKKISKKEYDNILMRYSDKVMSQLEQSMGNQQFINKIRTNKSNYMYDENGKRVRNNRTEDGKRKKFVRSNKAQNFWNNLQA